MTERIRICKISKEKKGNRPVEICKHREYKNTFCHFQAKFKREGVEDNALKEWKRSIFTIVDKRIKFYSQNTSHLGI